MISYRLTQRLLSAEFTNDADAAIANRLLTGLCDIVSGLPTERLWDLSRLIRQHESLTAAITRDPPDQHGQQIASDDSLEPGRRALDEFLETWGFRCSGELMLTHPSYQEDPASLIPILATYVTRNGESPEEHLQRQQQCRERETERVLRVLRTKKMVFFSSVSTNHIFVTVGERCAMWDRNYYPKIRNPYGRKRVCTLRKSEENKPRSV